MQAALGWQLTALQSDDSDVASHALLRLWQRVRDAADHERSTALMAINPRQWRRLGLLLFASDPITVRAVVSVLAISTSADGDPEWQRPVRLRVWQTDWRQFLIDKLVDCLSRMTAETSPIARKPSSLDEELCMRLLLVLRRVVSTVLSSGVATAKDQARLIDLLVHAASSPADSVACLALHTLLQLVGSTEPALDAAVRAYLCASPLFPDLVAWLRTRFAACTQLGPHSRTSRPRPRDAKRSQLALEVLLEAARVDQEAAAAVARDASVVIGIVLGVLERPESSTATTALQSLALCWLEALLQHESAASTSLVSAIRLSGALISLSWLLTHSAEAVRRAAHAVVFCVARLSAPVDITRAMIEQGCVLVLFLGLADERSSGQIDDPPCRNVLRWVIETLMAHDQLATVIADTVYRSSNARLQRNVLLSLVLLSQADAAVLDVGYLRESMASAVHGHIDQADGALSTSLLALALLCSDRSSTLKLDSAASASFRKSQSRLTTLPPDDGPVASPQIVLECSDESHVVVHDKPLFLAQCTRVQRHFASSPASPIRLRLGAFSSSCVRLLLGLLPLSSQRAAAELKQLDKEGVVELLRLAKLLGCAKCWHAATLVISNALDSANWKATLDSARRVPHPGLWQRALRVALHSPAASTGDISDAALSAWGELLASRLQATD